nr:MAG TPA: hypothetical protein [Caudoviricetes sp.]
MSLPSAGFFSAIFFDKIYIFPLLLFPFRVIYIHSKGENKAPGF